MLSSQQSFELHPETITSEFFFSLPNHITKFGILASVHNISNGEKQIILTSPYQICNNLNCEIFIKLFSVASPDAISEMKEGSKLLENRIDLSEVEYTEYLLTLRPQQIMYLNHHQSIFKFCQIKFANSDWSQKISISLTKTSDDLFDEQPKYAECRESDPASLAINRLYAVLTK